MPASDECRPPKDPWIRIAAKDESQSSLTFYYSDDLSPLPVRHVTKPGDNKADPNLETLTYGLFSTCGRGSRSAIVANKRPYLFFFTRRNDERVLTGYYEIGWYAEHSGPRRDFALAANSTHFVQNPIPLDLVDEKCATTFSRPFRQTRLMTSDKAARLRELLHNQSDATEDYVQESRRLERFNSSRGGYRHVGLKRTQPFTWTDACPILNSSADGGQKPKLSTESPTGIWSCRKCGNQHANERLLRQCPECNAANSLEPVCTESAT